MIRKDYTATILFFLIVAIFFYLFYRLMVPFVAPIAWAGILVIVFYPLYKRILKKVKSSTLASLLSCFLILIIILGPSIYLLASLVNEAAYAVQKVNAAYQGGQLEGLFSPITPLLNLIKNKLRSYPQLANVDFISIVKDAIASITKAIGSQATTVIANISRTIFYFLLTLFTMFFFFRDGERIIDFLKRITPVEKEQVAYLFSHFRRVIEGMMYGGVVMALIQGTLGGILFAIVGISSAVLWGSVMALLAFIPIVGPFLVYIPAGIILLIGGSYIKGIIVLTFGTVVISHIDNFVRPLLFTGKTQTHTLMLFFSIMGGIYMFGLLGIVLGPFIAAVFISILKMFELQLHPPAEIVLTSGPDSDEESDN
jgi:predicted PurR-regulated permease PerM